MGKPVKLSDRDKRWYRPGGKTGRPRPYRQVRRRILIVCEGTKTEPLYFEAIRKILPPHIVSISIAGEGANTLSLVQRARGEYQSRLTQLLGEHYRKNSTDMYSKLSCRGDQKQAIARARRLFDDFVNRHLPFSQANPCTTVYRLIDELNGYLPPDAVAPRQKGQILHK